MGEAAVHPPVEAVTAASVGVAVPILLIDDHPVFCLAAKSMIEQATGIPVRTAATLQLGLAALESRSFQLVLIDLSLPDSDAKNTAVEVRTIAKTHRVLVIAASEWYEDARVALAAGALGFVPKTSEPEDIVAAVRAALVGDRIVPKTPPTWVTGAGRAPSDSPARIDGPQSVLTPRQWEVLQAIAAGKSNKIIARELGIAERTIKVHVTAVFRAIGVANRTQAALLVMAVR